MNERLAGFGAPFGPLIKPLTKVNRFMLAQLEKGVTLGLDSMRAYADLGVAQVKVALKVTDSHSLHEFADSQFAVLSFVGHRMLDDSRVLNEWGMESCNQAHGLVRENMMRLFFK